MLKIVLDGLRGSRVTEPMPGPGEGFAGPLEGRLGLRDGAREAVAAAIAGCPTGALAAPEGDPRELVLDEGRCVGCALCAEGPRPAMQVVNEEPCASRRRDGLVRRFPLAEAPAITGPDHAALDLGRMKGDRQKLSELVKRRLRGSLHVRHLDAGGCNGCEWELNQLQGPHHDLQRFGVDFVASPRHADLLLVTGVVTRNLELALVRTLDAMPRPRLVVAVGACAISGGIFGTSYASAGGVDRVVAVDAYVAGCAPRPWAILRGMMLALE